MQVHIENNGINMWANKLYYVKWGVLLNGAIFAGTVYEAIKIELTEYNSSEHGYCEYSVRRRKIFTL
jgi:hypothetical protein